MPENPTAHSPHVQKLIDEKYKVTLVEDQYIIIDDVPYVSAANTVSRGAIISAYYYKNGTETFGDHTVLFTGSAPCTANGDPLDEVLIADKNKTTVAGREVQCRFSNKSSNPDMLSNIYNKLIHYVTKLEAYANVVDSAARASGSGSIATIRLERSVFFFPNTAIARAGLDEYENKLKLPKVAIVGLGGTGSYILDALAKTPVAKIHLYDDDTIDPATVYRMPGALTIEEAHKGTYKTDYLRDLYGKMRTDIYSHPYRVKEENKQELQDCNFVFIAIDHGPSRLLLATFLTEKNIPFVDVGIGVDRVAEDKKLIARVRVTSINSENKDLVSDLPTADDKEDAVYNNIQLAELNALNAMLAVIVYKQKIGFYSEEFTVQALRYRLSWQRLSHFPENT